MTSRFRAKISVLSDEMHEWLLVQCTQTADWGMGRCPWCFHDWHGVRCGASSTCHCDSATPRTDDTWRPRFDYSYGDKARRLCADTGVDGYVAVFIVGSSRPIFPPKDIGTKARLEKLLLGTAVVYAKNDEPW